MAWPKLMNLRADPNLWNADFGDEKVYRLDMGVYPGTCSTATGEVTIDDTISPLVTYPG